MENDGMVGRMEGAKARENGYIIDRNMELKDWKPATSSACERETSSEDCYESSNSSSMEPKKMSISLDWTKAASE